MQDAEKVFEGERLIVYRREKWEFVERRSAREAVAVVALTDDGQLILTEQQRRPVDARVIDLPAGLIGDEPDGPNDAASAARTELREETGYDCARVEPITRFASSPGITSEIVHLYRAHGVRKVGEGGGVGGENITVHLVPPAGFELWAKGKQQSGALIDPKIWAALFFIQKGS